MKAFIKTVLATCLLLGGTAVTQSASAGDLVIRIGNGGGGYHAYHGHRAMPRVAHPRRAYVRPAPPRVVYVRPAPPRYVHPRPVHWGGYYGGHGHHGGCSRC